MAKINLDNTAKDKADTTQGMDKILPLLGAAVKNLKTITESIDDVNSTLNSRKTTDVFEMASGIILQTSVQCVAMQPNNLEELPEVEIDFLKKLPTTWEETIFIDGYPGKFVVLARRHEDKWYVVGLNAEKEDKELMLELPMIEEESVDYYTDDDKGYALLTELKADDGKFKIKMKPNGGFIIK